MQNKSLFEIFSQLKIDQESVDALKDAQVEEVTLDKSSRSMQLCLRLQRVCPAPVFDKLSGVLRDMYELKKVVVCPVYPDTCFGEDGFASLIRRIKKHFPKTNGFMDGAKWEITEGGLNITLKTIGSHHLGGVADYIQNTALNEYGLTLRVQIIDAENTALAEEEEKRKQHREKAIAKAIEQMPAVKSSSKSVGSNGCRTFMGKAANIKTTPMEQLAEQTGKVSVTGRVFFNGSREITGRSAFVLSFDMTDYTSSVRVNQFMRISNKNTDGNGRGKFWSRKDIDNIIEAAKPGSYITVQGKMVMNQYDEDLVLEPQCIMSAVPEEVMDEADEKRVELHLHTTMSAMDGLTDVKEVISRAAAWGHKAIAITDHGGAQAFPDADKAAKGKDIKILYGCEGYFVNDTGGLIAVRGSKDEPLEGEFVAFDIETTGLYAATDEIIEIAAVLIRNGEFCGSYHSYVNPGREIPAKITQLTGITDADVAEAPSIEPVLTEFLNFAGSRVLAAHNASFDMGFISAACEKYGKEKAFTSIDTVNLSRALLPGLTNYKLDTVAKALNMPKFDHHRAQDDTEAAGFILIQLIKKLKDEGVHSTLGINTAIAGRQSSVTKKQMYAHPYHIILIAKTRTGLKNLYRLISEANINHFYRNPIIPKSLLDNYREGLIVGSACERSDLFSAIVKKRPWEELTKLAGYYDYLEIQPLCNNEFMLDSGMAASVEDLKEFNRTVVKLGQQLNIPVVATGDVHFLDKHDAIYRSVILGSKGFSDANRQTPLYFRTTKEMLEEFAYLGKDKAHEVVVTNPNAIADLCDALRPVPSGTYPPKIKGSAQELENLTRSKAVSLYGENLPAQVSERMEIELQNIIKHSFDVIYMIAQKLVAQSMQDGYLVGSRGSVGSSIVAFFSGITEVNSLPPHYRCPSCKHSEFIEDSKIACGADLPDKNCPVCGTKYDKDGFDIPFATFLGFDGDKQPDIDLNFSGEYQARAHEQTMEIFGKDHVFRAGTISTVADKTAYGYVKKYLEEQGMTVPKAEENRLAVGCTGVRRTTGQHPGGLVVVPDDHEIYEFCPIQHPADDTSADTITTHFEYHSIEENLLKLDLLAHDNPTIIRMLTTLTGVEAQNIPLDDKDTMSIFTSSKVLGFEDDAVLGPTGACAVPEFGTRNTREMLLDTRPTTFDELVRISGLSHGEMVWRGNAKDIIAAGTATLKEVICARDDIMLYLIAKGVEKKLAFTIMESVRKGRGLKSEWESEMTRVGVPAWYIESCNKIKYMFPKGHAVAYVVMAFRIAWFKVHYPKEFYCSFFTIRAGLFDAALMTKGISFVRDRMRELERKSDATANDKEMITTYEVCYEFFLRGFTFDRVDVYLSDPVKFILTDKGLRPPLSSLAGLGEKAARDIAEQRALREFTSVEDLSNRCAKVSKAHIEQLESVGALGDMPKTSQLSLF